MDFRFNPTFASGPPRGLANNPFLQGTGTAENPIVLPPSPVQRPINIPVSRLTINLRHLVDAPETNSAGPPQPQLPLQLQRPEVQNVHYRQHSPTRIKLTPIRHIPQNNGGTCSLPRQAAHPLEVPSHQTQPMALRDIDQKNEGASSLLRQAAQALQVQSHQYQPVASKDDKVSLEKLIELFPNVDINFLKQEYLRRAGDEAALNVFISEMLDNNRPGVLPLHNSTNDDTMKRYKMLSNAFPDADTQFLWNQSLLHPDDNSVTNFIEHTRRRNDYPRQTDCPGNIEKHFEKLLQLFPDADPQYLWKKCEEKGGNEAEMQNFIDMTLREQNYPKLPDVEKDLVDAHVTELHYQRLLEVFPDAEPEYLWEQCKLRSKEPEKLEEFILQTIQDGNYPKSADIPVPKAVVIEGVNESLQEVAGNQYRHLLEMLPNADPTYLLENVKRLAGDETALENFIADALENENYPTVEHHLQAQKVNELRKKYIDEFFPSDFIELFPDPWKYFLDEKPDNKEPCPLAVMYMQRRYLDLDSEIIDAAYKNNGYSIARTCKALDTDFPKKRESRSDILYNLSDLTVPFVQEVAFVENEPALLQHREFKKKIRERLLKRAREVGTLIECSCCYNDELLPEDVASCSSGHLFCVECVARGAETAIGDGKIIFPCFQGDECNGEFSLPTLKSVLKPTVFSNLLLRKQMVEVTEAGVPDVETCPFCDFVTMKADDDVKIFSCRNPQCMKDSCRLCREPSHIPFRCNEVEKPEEIRMRTFIEDKMTQALVRECYNCKRKFIKQDGCNKMSCQCGAIMCYICRQPVKGYEHFSERNANSKCPLWSKNEDLHVTQVMNEGLKAKDQVLASNPEYVLKNDPTLVPPK